jgi:hypothetical protein
MRPDSAEEIEQVTRGVAIYTVVVSIGLLLAATAPIWRPWIGIE